MRLVLECGKEAQRQRIDGREAERCNDEVPDAGAVGRELVLKLHAGHAQRRQLVGMLGDMVAQLSGDDFANPADGFPAPRGAEVGHRERYVRLGLERNRAWLAVHEGDLAEYLAPAEHGQLIMFEPALQGRDALLWRSRSGRRE